ncbi:MAG: hypothetical protein A2X81_17220 [Desulfobacterales bacterium GWB2_56_26]|nr:MAG: hypothetical protein A2X81_17220 [Desulfobacterales bacterium GWB2_56_26]
MIIDALQNSDRYAAMHPGFTKAFAFLRRPDLKDLVAGRHEIDGDRVFAIVAKDAGRSRDSAQLETHEKYIDIQLVLAGHDDMGWRPQTMCRVPTGAHDPENDIRFFADQPLVWQPVGAGMFAIFFPEDAHQPLIGEGTIHKVVVKVAVDGR